MSTKIKDVFRVVSTQDEDICLKTIENGLTVFVENRKYFYDNITWNRVKDLSENDIKRITLESQNNMNTIWHIESIDDV
jgi:hypothetical protein